MRARGAGEGGERVGGKGLGGVLGGVLAWASGYNFPLFLVYPVDMPGNGRSYRSVREGDVIADRAGW